jgi:hypothetical protein
LPDCIACSDEEKYSEDFKNIFHNHSIVFAYFSKYKKIIKCQLVFTIAQNLSTKAGFKFANWVGTVSMILQGS